MKWNSQRTRGHMDFISGPQRARRNLNIRGTCGCALVSLASLSLLCTVSSVPHSLPSISKVTCNHKRSMYLMDSSDGSHHFQTRADYLTPELWALTRGRRGGHSLIMDCSSSSDHTPPTGSGGSQRKPSKHLVPPFLMEEGRHSTMHR